jgi:acetyl coenzyme A synthetase (ADP forming)-like protein
MWVTGMVTSEGKGTLTLGTERIAYFAVVTGNLRPILSPASVAVVGASRTPGTIGHEIVASLLRCGYTGAVYPVNPRATAICAVPAFPDIEAIPVAIDQAIIVVPKELVQQVAEGCARKGIPGLVVISSGFKEIGGEGIERERRLTAFVRANGMRMVGPNCMGVLNANPAVSMNGTFAPSLPPYGKVGFVSQSGAMGLSVLDYAREYGIGISQFVSVGNKPDVSGNDLLLAWEDEPDVEVILMYVENFGNPAKFLQLASRITKRKPIIVVKAGRSQAGARAASSHTGALAASDAAVDALLAQAGVLRAGTVEELFDLAMGFSVQAAPRSRRTAVLTNAGGPGILAADACEANGLELPDLAPATVARLAPLFPAEASIRNPLDMIASATPKGYRAALAALLDDPNVDAALAIFVPPLGVTQQDVTLAIASVAEERPAKTVFGVLMGHQGLPQGRATLHDAGIPAYIFPESAARALAAMCRWREWQDRPPEVPEELRVDAAAARRIIDAARAEGRSRLAEDRALELLAAYGIPVARGELAVGADEAVRHAERMGYPVVLKIVAPAIIHKTEVGGVRVNLGDAAEVRRAYDQILLGARAVYPAAVISGVLVQRMVQDGRELIVGMTRDPVFGPLVMFGLGGILVEVLRDVSFRIAPFGRDEARRMMREIRGAALLDAVRGMSAADRPALEDVLLRIARLVTDCPEIAELDVNPLMAMPVGAVAADARVMLAPGPTPSLGPPAH